MATTEKTSRSRSSKTTKTLTTKKTPKSTEVTSGSKENSIDKSSFAVIETGAKQYKVSEGDILNIEKLPKFKEGGKINFDKVLMIDNGKEIKIGDPFIKGAKVEAEFIEEGRSKKISVIKYKSKSRYFKNKGHRQPFSKVRIIKI